MSDEAIDPRIQTGEPIEGERPGFACPQCGHRHTSQRLGFICIGCPCEVRPGFNRCPECGNLATEPDPTCEVCGESPYPSVESLQR